MGDMDSYVPLRKRLQQYLTTEASSHDDSPPQSVISQTPPLVDAASSAHETMIEEATPIGSASIAEHALVNVPLDRIIVDPHQPRRFLPADLRASLSTRALTPLQAMSALIERAARQDPEATGYMESIAGLAKSIDAVGVLQPIRVALEPAQDGAWFYQLVDGERRFWACLCLNAKQQPNDSTRILTVPGVLQHAGSSDDDMRRAQWTINLQREEVPAVDYAETVWQVREDYLSRLQTDRQRYLSDLGDRGEDVPLTEAAVLLTTSEVQRLTSRSISRTTAFRCCAITEKLLPQTKALARAYNLTFRQLMGLANVAGDQQLRAAMAMTTARHEGTGASITRDTKTRNDSSRAGRPTQLQRGINQCAGLLSVLSKLTEKHLRNAEPTSVQALAAELDRVLQEAERCRRLVRAVLNR
jgi:hypothetical protein